MDPTLPQSGDELLRAQHQSVQRLRPPTNVPGYEPLRFLGSGAYGEVWVATDLNTRRRVAIKFYTHRSGLDWSLLSREVEKLALLFADRYVVQLIDVAWDATPPYYVMEYLEHGSLADRLQNGRLSTGEAVALFRDITIGLMHAHGKGVLHCDLKPGNILLDQDSRPRLADFGQSRLTNEQHPALGTLFYMAPEQAHLQAVPDARWDVYALGAVLYCMLTGEPPYRTTEAATLISQGSGLSEQLERYVRFLHESPRPAGHRQVAGVDRELADIVDRCLALNPQKRFANPQAVLDALDLRAQRRARRPLLVLGALGPAVMLLVMLLFAASTANTSVRQSERALVQLALDSNQFAARFVAESVAGHIERRWRLLEQVAQDPEFRERFFAAIDQPLDSPQRQALQIYCEQLDQQHPEITATSWLVMDSHGLQMARSPLDQRTIDRQYNFRDYFHGQGKDLPPGTPNIAPIERPHRSLVFRSQATQQRMLAFSVPLWNNRSDPGPRHVVGVLAVTVELGHFAELRSLDNRSRNQLAVLVDTRIDETGHRGSILEHPHLAQLHHEGEAVPRVYLSSELIAELRNLERAKAAQLPELVPQPPEPSQPPESPQPPAVDSGAAPTTTDTSQPTAAAELAGAAEPATAAELTAADSALLGEPAAPTFDDHYRDPVGGDYAGRWLAAFDPVLVAGEPQGGNIGWTIVVQERYDEAVQPARLLGKRLVRTGLWALAIVVAMTTALWGFVLIVLNESPRHQWLRWLRRRTGLSFGGGSSSNTSAAASSIAGAGESPAATNPSMPQTHPHQPDELA